MTDIEKLLGGVELDAAFVDGKTERVKVRELPIKDLPRYLELSENEARCVDLFCDKPAGWSESMTRQSFEEIMLKGEELNLDFLSRSVARAVRRREAIMPGFQDRIVNQIVERSTSTSPGSPSKPG